MAINKNHEFDDLQGIKCAIVEKNASQQRVDFLKPLLECNGYTVVVVPAPPAKASTPTADTETAIPTTFIIGVTDVTFNSLNAVFGRLLKTKDGHVVSLAYWQQKETVSDVEVPYYEKKKLMSNQSV